MRFAGSTREGTESRKRASPRTQKNTPRAELAQLGKAKFKVSKHGLLTAIGALRPNAKPGTDKTTGAMLKHLPTWGIVLLRQVVEESVSTGRCVKQCEWKDGGIVVIYKGGSKPKSQMPSYRPVTLASIISKVVEKIVVGVGQRRD